MIGDYHKDHILKYPPEHSFLEFRRYFNKSDRQSMVSLLFTPDEKDVFNEYTKNSYGNYLFILPLIFIPFYKKIPLLKNYRILRFPIGLTSLMIPFSVANTYRIRENEALEELYEMKREQSKLYKQTGDIKYMNRFLKIVKEWLKRWMMFIK